MKSTDHSLASQDEEGPLQKAQWECTGAASSSTPDTFSSFSVTSTLEDRVFRVDEGRLYQATNDDYPLPADQPEQARLDNQHYAMKTILGDRNYLAPVDEFLNSGPKHMRGVDIGTGTGIWVREMALEFPHVEWTGVDIIPVEPDDEVPDNVHFVQDDIARGLGFPDGYFDIVHARFLLLGIRNWEFVMQEATRILRPGGMLVWVDITLAFQVEGVTMAESWVLAPGYMRMLECVAEAARRRGLDTRAGENIAPIMRTQGVFEQVNQTSVPVPFWAWSDDPVRRKAGAIMVHNARELASSARLFVMDGCEISDEDYRELTRVYLADVGKPGAHFVLPTWHNWAWKLT